MEERNYAFKWWLIFGVIALLHIDPIQGWRTFWKGRHYKGNLHVAVANVSREQLPPHQWFTQKLDHFDASNTETWQQVSGSSPDYLNPILKLIWISRAAVLCERHILQKRWPGVPDDWRRR